MKYLAGVVTLKLDTERCRGCWLCLDVCPRGVFRREDSVVAVADPDACMECGACARNCPHGALYVRTGVGCAAAVINSLLRGGEPQCGSDCSPEPAESRCNDTSGEPQADPLRGGGGGCDACCG